MPLGDDRPAGADVPNSAKEQVRGRCVRLQQLTETRRNRPQKRVFLVAACPFRVLAGPLDGFRDGPDADAALHVDRSLDRRRAGPAEPLRHHVVGPVNTRARRLRHEVALGEVRTDGTDEARLAAGGPPRRRKRYQLASTLTGGRASTTARC